MIANDDELKGTRDRIAYFEDLLAQMRVAASPDLFPSMASGYRAEIEKMQREVLEHLTSHVGQRQPAEVRWAASSHLAAHFSRMQNIQPCNGCVIVSLEIAF